MRLLLALLITALAPLATATPVLQIDHLPFATGERAAQPSVAVDPREGFVLTWQERDGSDTVLRFAVIDATGSERRRGEIARGSDWFVNGADFPNLAVLDNGDWVTFYLPKTSPGTYSYEIRTVRSRDAGASWEAPVLLHRDGTDTEHGFVSMVAAGDDRVRAVWLDGRHMSGGHDDHGDASSEHMTLRSAALGRDGVLFDEHELDNLTCACCQTDAVRIGERVVVAYRDRTRDEQRDINLVEFAAGQWSSPQRLHEDGWIIAACPVNGPAVAATGDQIAVLWPTMAGGEMRLNVSVGHATLGPPQTLASGSSELGRVDIAGWTDDRWLATRVATPDRVPALQLSLLAADGTALQHEKIADKVGGYPRLAAHEGVALLVWAEQGGRPGTSQVGVARVTDGKSSGE
jgi:hypothetical protein